jgi:hypothetical protein
MAISNNSTGLRPGVCTSTTRPTAPYEGQHIYETDTDLMLVWSGSAWVEVSSMLTKAPRGIISRTESTTGSADVSVETLRLTSPSFTAVANRFYRITYFEPAINYVSGTVNYVAMAIRLTNITGTRYNESAVKVASASQATGVCEIVTTLPAGSTVFVATFIPSGGGLARCGASPGYVSQLVIEDIGAA